MGNDHGQKVTRDACVVGLHGCAWDLQDSWCGTYVVVTRDTNDEANIWCTCHKLFNNSLNNPTHGKLGSLK